MYTLNASVLWIHHKAWRAEFADSFVLFDVTRSVLRTGRVLARIAALIVDAGHVGRAASIAQADRHGCRAVFDTDAHGPVVQHLTDLVGCCARVASSSARILTAARDASQVAGALVVDSALDRVRSARHLAGVVQHEAVLADADGAMPTDFAPFALVARDALEIARILASAQIGVARVVRRALVVPGANAHHWRGLRSGRALHWTGRRDNGDRSLRGGAASRVRRALDGRPADVTLRARASGLV